MSVDCCFDRQKERENGKTLTDVGEGTKGAADVVLVAEGKVGGGAKLGGGGDAEAEIGLAAEAVDVLGLTGFEIDVFASLDVFCGVASNEDEDENEGKFKRKRQKANV